MTCSSAPSWNTLKFKLIGTCSLVPRTPNCTAVETMCVCVCVCGNVWPALTFSAELSQLLAAKWPQRIVETLKSVCGSGGRVPAGDYSVEPRPSQPAAIIPSTCVWFLSLDDKRFLSSCEDLNENHSQRCCKRETVNS